MPPGHITVTKAEFEGMLARASEEGARRALERIGLTDEHAARDVDELRTLLSSFRKVKQEA